MTKSEQVLREPHTGEKIRTDRGGGLYWKTCGCEATEGEKECRYCGRVFHCNRCGWTGTYPPRWDGEIFGGLHVCPKCCWTKMGLLHVGASWPVIDYER